VLYICPILKKVGILSCVRANEKVRTSRTNNK
jgi:hypothetical protein